MNEAEERFLFELPPQNLKEAEIKFKERNSIWTECKARLIERYLFYSTRARSLGKGSLR
jgi:hypothetical protein